MDLIRALLTAYAGRDDLVHGLDLAAKQANNFNGAGPKGIEGDLASDNNWFFEDEFDKIVSDIYFGYELEGLKVSASYGTVTCNFTNGQEIDCDILIGADGFHSKVRALILNARSPPQHSQSCILQGISNIHFPPPDAPTELEDGTRIEQMNKDQLLKFCPDGTGQTFMGDGVSFGVFNLGNGMIGWNLVAKQQKPRQWVDQVIEVRNRHQLAAKVASLGSQGLRPQDFGMDPVQRMKSGGSAEFWMIPGSERSSVGHPRTSDARNSHVPITNSSEHTSLVSPVIAPSQEPQVAEPNTQMPPPPEPLLSDNLYPDEIIALGLSLGTKDVSLPKQLFSLIASSDPRSVCIHDNVDLSEEPPSSYTTPQFHPGRVILIGDAAHTLSTNAHGSVGASLAITDSVTLAKLLGYAYSPQGMQTILASGKDEDLDSILLGHVATQFTQLRQTVSAQYMHDARVAVQWKRQSDGLWKSLSKMSVGYTWARMNFVQMQNTGQSTMDPSIPWPKLH